MKINKLAAVLMSLMLCLMAVSALASEFTIDEYGVVSAITADSDIEALVLPAKVRNVETDEDVQVGKITADFSRFEELQYILFDESDRRLLPKVDLTTVPNLECVYFKLALDQDTLEELRQKIKVNDGIDLLQWAKISNKSIIVGENKYDNGKVTISFSDVIPDGYGGYGYEVVRISSDGSGSEEYFDSETSLSQFETGNGTVVFTDFIEQTDTEQTYCYSITAYDPFGAASGLQNPVRVTIPAKAVPTPTPTPAPAVSTPTPAPAPIPATGDEAHPVLWTALIAMSAIGMLMLLRKRKEA